VGETAELVKARKQATGSIETRGKQSGVQDTEEEHTAAS
jgi:hypothetical protein